MAGLLILGYAGLSSFARRPLTLPEFRTFAAAVLRATPAHLSGRSLLKTLRLGGTAFGSPTEAVTLSASGEAPTIPLPPRTSCVWAPQAQMQRFVTFATPEDLYAYFHATLPQAGWTYREQLGSIHVLERDSHLLLVRSTFFAGTRIGELHVSLSTRGPAPPN